VPDPKPVRRRSFLDRLGRQLGGRTFLLVLGGLAVAFLALLLWLLLPFWRLVGRFDDRTVRQPSRLYARSTVVAVGDHGAPATLGALFADLGYRAIRPGVDDLRVGAFGVSELATGPDTSSDAPPADPRPSKPAADGTVAVSLRRYPTVEGPAGGGMLEVRYRGGEVVSMHFAGTPVARYLLEPPLLASFYGPAVEERRPVTLADLPLPVVRSILAAEDARFYQHGGLSFIGIARAIWSNLTTDGLRQGGSTLTQQLVKNIFLSPERSLERKAREAVLSILLEMRYSKDAILQAYLNEIFWGRSGGVNLVGLGAVSHAYFGKDPAALDLDESALLAGIIQAPNALSPLAHPEKAKARRDWVLGRLAELGWATPAEVTVARAKPIHTDPHPPVIRGRAGYFADGAITEALDRYGVRELADSGYVLLSSLDWQGQRAAEDLVAKGLADLEKGWEKGRQTAQPLQAALVSLDPRSGEVLAWVGGRDYRASQFDRVALAHRQIGSAMKPVVLAAAFAQGFQPATLVEDAPLTVSMAGRLWEPQNDDDEFLGWITVRQAVEQSRNVPIARLALQTGLPAIAELVQAMGLERRPAPLPSLALGAIEATPLELATIYGTLADQGTRPPPPHALLTVWNRYGERLPAVGTPAPQPVIAPDIAFLVTSVLQGVLDRGTGAATRQLGLTDPLAGKSGTTNDRRDSWFCGYGPDRVTVVWIGYDDNTATRLSGSRAAVPIWARYMRAVRPAGGFLAFPAPTGVVAALIDPESGELAGPSCPTTRVEYFAAGHAPQTVCARHQPGGTWVAGLPSEGALPESAAPEAEPTRKGRFRAWLDRVFGSSKPPS
jgi:penicillin-binding protein 1B